MVVGAVALAACSPGEGPESIPLPTSPDATTTSSTTTTTTTTTLVPPTYEATIRRTTDGVPHITGDTVDDVAYGQGWVSGEDHGCTLIDQVLKVSSTRAVALGPGLEGENVDSDFAWAAIGIAEIAADDFETIASADVVAQFEAFTAGWNDQLADVGGERLTGWCAGADWVRPITPVEVYAYARSVALLASSGAIIDFIGSAQPPETPVVGLRNRPSDAAAPRTSGIDLDEVAAADLGLRDPAGLASNGWAIGQDQVAGGDGGILLANPHFPWEGELRFAEVQLTVPGEFDVYGANLLGLPGIGIGFTDGVAWTHTVSAGSRLTGYNLTLDPATPTSYLVDGVSVPMTSSDATIEILRADGTIDTETRTLWRSEYGPIIDFPGIGWTTTNVFSYRDANIDNNEFLEQYSRMPGVQSIADLQSLNEEYQGVPLFNTIAVDDAGNAWYADTSAAPNLSTEAEAAYIGALFTDLLTQIAYEQGFILLDGSNSLFRWEDVEGARDPGLVPYAEMPMIERTDHVFNANDSFWVPNAETTLTGAYSIAYGEQGTPLSLRTRQNAAVLDPVEPDRPCRDPMHSSTPRRFVPQHSTTRARQRCLLLDAAVAACRSQPLVEVADLPAARRHHQLAGRHVDLTAACDVLAAWDGVYDLDRSGPIVWRETTGPLRSSRHSRPPEPLFADAFDPAAPHPRRRRYRTRTRPHCSMSMARAEQTIVEAGFAVDTTLGAAQFTERSETRIPIHGGTEHGRRDQRRHLERTIVVERAGSRTRRPGRRREFAPRRGVPHQLRHQLRDDRRLHRRRGRRPGRCWSTARPAIAPRSSSSPRRWTSARSSGERWPSPTRRSRPTQTS